MSATPTLLETSEAFTVDRGRLVRELSAGTGTWRSSVPADESSHLDPRGSWWRAHLRGERPVPVEASPPRSVRFAELFCGSGGLALGFDLAARELGLRPVSMGAADQDADALAVYRRHNATRVTSTRSVSVLVDQRTSGIGERCEFVYEPEMVDPAWAGLVGQVDVLLAGPPCQGHSSLNNHTRGSDRRNELYLTVPAVAIALGVKTVIIENVRAVVHDRLQVVQSAVTLLQSAGYAVAQGVVKAAQLGWPQRRERYFVVARLGATPLDLGQLAAALGEPARDIWWAIGDLEDEPSSDFMTEQPVFSDDNRRRIDWLFDNDAHDLPYSERPECHREGTTYNAVYGRLRRELPAPTITTGFMTPGRGRYIHPTRRRVLTPREAARLQGFPDTYDFRVDGQAPSKMKLAKWIGDAVPMPLGHLATLSALLAT